MENKFGVGTKDPTVLLYLENYKSMELHEIITFNNLFELLVENSLEEGNYVENGFIKRGIKLKPATKKCRANNSFDLRPVQISTDARDMMFFKSLYSFSKALPYLTADDRFCLNNIFDGMFRLGKGIGEIREIQGQRVLPIYNYKKGAIERKNPIK